MAGRPQLPIGTHGSISTVLVSPKVWEARCRYCDADGTTRKVKRQGRSKSAAENNLRAALAERRHTAGADLTPDSRVAAAAAMWFAHRRSEVEAGDLSISTFNLYEDAWRLYVADALGGVRLREITVARCEAWKVALSKSKGRAATKSARTVLSGVLGYAARMGALATNPTRDMSRIPGTAKRKPRAMTRDERLGWLSAMENHEPLVARVLAAQANGNAAELAAATKALRVMRKAVRWDIPDLTRFMLATGCRVGEALAVSWDEVTQEAGVVQLGWRLVPVRGEGVRRVCGTKGSQVDREQLRTLRVPRWCADMLMDRKVAELSGYPVFPDSLGGWRDPHNVSRALREARDAAGYSWVTSHVFRKTCLTALDEAKLTPRELADVAGHADPSMTQRVYMGRGLASSAAADALEDLL